MNEHSLNIKVDREERPRSRRHIQKSAQAFMRRGGGWRLTIFLTPEKEPFWGWHVLSPGFAPRLPGFPEVLLGVVEAYRKEPGQG